MKEEKPNKQLEQTSAHREDGIFVSFNFDQFPNYTQQEIPKLDGSSENQKKSTRNKKKVNAKTTGYEFYES